jgi:serine/threonine protein kinase
VTDESVFAAALAISDPTDRAAYLDRACAGNPVLRAEVDALLSAHAADNPLDRTAPRPASVGEPTAAVGDRVGPYKLLEKIGEGGMGEVWVADQLEPIKRRVALKLIKPGMDTRSVLGRFEAERQALAVMDHPNIAKVLDAGTTPDGRPYFVMELVKGTPITEFADASKLTPKQRLELFVPVCQAIQHAHMKGIIHRDIKPSNVLVALHDETPVPKVIDFGVAKAIGQQLTEKTIYTGFGSLIGTPAYMAPEQATFNQLDVDTRADVYALGVLLYELLAGSPPIERDRLKKAALDEVLRIVRDEEPPRPSQRLAQTRNAERKQRNGKPTSSWGRIRAALSFIPKSEIRSPNFQELDWIVMKAMEKDRARRYETANGLANDIIRYLSYEPVQAAPPNLWYRLRKAYYRNKVATMMASAVAIVLLVVGLSAGMLISYRVQNADRLERDWLNREVERVSGYNSTQDGVSEVADGVRSLGNKWSHEESDYRLFMTALFCVHHPSVAIAGEDALVNNYREAWPHLVQVLRDGTHRQARRVAMVFCRANLEGFVTSEMADQVVPHLIRHYPRFIAESRAISMGGGQWPTWIHEQNRRENRWDV